MALTNSLDQYRMVGAYIQKNVFHDKKITSIRNSIYINNSLISYGYCIEKNIYLYIKQDSNNRYSVEIKKYTDDGKIENNITKNIDNMNNIKDDFKECYELITVDSMFDINIGDISEVLGSNLAIGVPF